MYSFCTQWAYKRIEVLKGISLDVHQGEAFGFLGHNGAGKTTTIKCVLNLCAPKRGTILVNGIDSKDPAARKNVGYLPEQPYFYDNITVKETLSLMADLFDMSPSEKKSRIAELLEYFELTGKQNAYTRNLSKGQMQQIGLAQAIIARPNILILDEPFSGLDPIGRKQVRDLLFDLKSKGTTLFISSHALSDIESLCDRVSILVKGGLKGVFSVKDLPNFNKQHFEITIVSSGTALSTLQRLNATGLGAAFQQKGNVVQCVTKNGDDAQQILSVLISGGEQVLRYEPIGRDLESLFVSVVGGANE